MALIYILIIVAVCIFAWISYELRHAWHIDKSGNLIPPPKHKHPPGIGHSVHPSRKMGYNEWKRYIHREVSKIKGKHQ